MVTTTDYGSWTNYTDALNIGTTVLDYVNGADSDWQQRMEASGAMAAIERDYADAINAALPDGVALCGDQFIGPFYDADCHWEGELDIKEIIENVDLAAIVERHDIDLAEAES